MSAYVPRNKRPQRLANAQARAFDANPPQGLRPGTYALERALAALGGVFGEAAVINSRKMQAEYAIQKGPANQWVRAHFGLLANILGLSDDMAVAIRQVQGAIFKAEITLRQQQRQGLTGDVGFSLTRARETLIILRWLRAKRMADYWPNILHVAQTPVSAICPEVFIMVPSVRFPVREVA